MADLLDLPAALERWGLTVVPVTGWEDRRRPGPFAPAAVLIHHTAGARGKDAPSLQLCIDGRQGLAGPLCQLLIARSGKVYVISRGRCNHAGEGGPKGPIGPDAGNAQSVGIEAENDGVGEPWPAVQVGAMVKATAAVLDLLGQPRANVWGHREYTPRKIDPAGISMATFRESVAAARPPGGPVPALPENDPGARIQRAINANGLQPPLKVDGDCGPATADGLDKVLAYLNGEVKRLGLSNRDTIGQYESKLAKAKADREAAEAEALQLRRQLQEGGRLPGLLADLEAAIAKARA